MSKKEIKRIFIVAAPEDKDYIHELYKYLYILEKNKKVALWHVGMLKAGLEKNKHILYRLEKADIILFLVTANSMSNKDLLEREWKIAIARQQQKTAKFIPILTRPYSWQEDQTLQSLLPNLTILPVRNGEPKAINTWDLQDEAYYNIVEELSNIIDGEVLRQPKVWKTSKKAVRPLLIGLFSLVLICSVFYLVNSTQKKTVNKEDKKEVVKEKKDTINTTALDLVDLTTNTKTLKLIKKANLILPDLSSYQQLEYIYIERCNLREIPKEIGRLKNLRVLALSNNELQTLPEEIFQLSNLVQLSINGNYFEKLPNKINQLKRLTILNLSYNHLSELPKAVTQLINLNRLYLNNNSKLTKLPEGIDNLTKLEYLNLKITSVTTIERQRIKELLPPHCQIYY